MSEEENLIALLKEPQDGLVDNREAYKTKLAGFVNNTEISQPTRVRLHLILGNMLATDRDQNQAETLLMNARELAETDEQHAQVTFAFAEMHTRVGAYERLLSMIADERNLNRSTPKSAFDFIERSNVYLEAMAAIALREVDRALSCADILKDAEPRDARADYVTARAMCTQGHEASLIVSRLETAVSNLEKFPAEQGPELILHTDLFEMLGTLYLRQGRKDAVRELVSTMIDVTGIHPPMGGPPFDDRSISPNDGEAPPPRSHPFDDHG